MSDNRFCRLVGTQLPILNAPIGTAATPELAAAVSNAGGLGLIAASFLNGADSIRAAIQKTKALTARPFGVNLLLEWDQTERLQICLEEQVPVISLFWGEIGPFEAMIHAAGALLMHTVGSVDEARLSAQQGADIIVAQGWEAGGHVRGDVSTLALIPNIVDAVGQIPVVAAGGIGDGRGVASVLVLGASAAMLGTRFIASNEAAVPDFYREAVIAAGCGDTVFGETFDKGWPDSNMRTLINSTMRNWINANRPAIGTRPGEHDEVARKSDGTALERYGVTQPHSSLQGDLEALALYAGQSAGLVKSTMDVETIMFELARQARRSLSHTSELLGT